LQLRALHLDWDWDDSTALLESMWLARRSRLSAPCFSCDELLLAMSVTETRRYRWSCLACGWRSPWFYFVEGQLYLDGSGS
jgi:hypothetical protein